MAARESIKFDTFYTRLRVDFDRKHYAHVGYCHSSNDYVAGIGEKGWHGKALFSTSDFRGPFYGFEAIFSALHSKLDELGLKGFPTDPGYVLESIHQPRPPKFKDMGEGGMTVEAYLATLDENGNPR